MQIALCLGIVLPLPVAVGVQLAVLVDEVRQIPLHHRIP